MGPAILSILSLSKRTCPSRRTDEPCLDQPLACFRKPAVAPTRRSAPRESHEMPQIGPTDDTSCLGIHNGNRDAYPGSRPMQSADSNAHPSAAFISALTTEHFVLQTAASSTINEAGARSSLYVFTLSSSLVAMGFMSQATEAFMPFVAAVIPAIFVLGVFTVVRLVDTTVENMQYLA